MKTNHNDKMLIYQSADGHIKIDVRFENETVWLSLDQMSTLFGRDKSTISRHIKNIFEEAELSPDTTIANYATVQEEGNREVTRNIDYYNLDIIISVGYRVKSQQGTQFRIWATQRLREYIIKGFTLNDERFKTGSSYNYFKELLDRIREIRLSEKVFYQQIKDIYATSIDYNPSAEMTLAFFKEVQNKLLWAVSGKTAAELVYYRANASLPMMGLTSTEKEGKVSKSDVLIGKNYLNEKEISQLKLIVEQFLAYAEAQALAEKPMYMRDWVQKLRLILTMNEKNILEHAGTISHELAVGKATKEYIAYKEQQRQIEHLESLKQLDKDLKRIASHKNNRKSKDKDQDNDLQRGRELHFKGDLHQAGHHQEQERQRAEEHILIISVQKLQDQCSDHKDTQRKVYDKRTSVLAQLHGKGGAQLLHPPFLPSGFPSVFLFIPRFISRLISVPVFSVSVHSSPLSFSSCHISPRCLPRSFYFLPGQSALLAAIFTRLHRSLMIFFVSSLYTNTSSFSLSVRGI